MKNKSVTQHAFSMVPSIAKPRSSFNRSHGYKTTFDAGLLVPFYHANVLPGDSVRLRHSILIRLLSPALKPFMDNLTADVFYFFVPYRLVWSNFTKFMGEQATPASSISYTIPQCTGPNVAAGGIEVGSLHDYLGLPTGALSGGGGTTGITFNNLIPRSYTKIWNEWFRDENLQDSEVSDVGDGPDTFASYTLLRRGKRFDYFTSCLPALQKGTAVTMSLGTVAPVETTGAKLQLRKFTTTAQDFTVDSGANATKTIQSHSDWTGAAEELAFGAVTGLQANLASATAATINTLRQSIALQQFLENDARGGTRYTELVRQRWGVTSPDARLQRTEILGISATPIRVHPVATTADTGVADPLAALGAFGTAVDVSNGFTKSFTEHGTIIGLISVRADLTYQQGIDRHWSYRTRYDLFNPEFANLGEQAVLNKEIFANVPDGTSSVQKDGTFGYQERYGEYRYSKSLITGLLRSDASGTLDIWHLSEDFSGLPTLGTTFIKSNPPVDRVIAVPSEPHFIMDVYFDENWARIMPMFSVPGLHKL